MIVINSMVPKAPRMMIVQKALRMVPKVENSMVQMVPKTVSKVMNLIVPKVLRKVENSMIPKVPKVENLTALEVPKDNSKGGELDGPKSPKDGPKAFAHHHEFFFFLR